MICVLPLTIALYWMILPELDGLAHLPVPGEIIFESEKPPAPGELVPYATAHPYRGALEALETSREKLGEKWEEIVDEINEKLGPGISPIAPDPETTEGFGDSLNKLRSSPRLYDKARVKELDRLSEVWYQRLLVRYPEMAIPLKTVPPEQNGFLKWLEFSERFDADAVHTKPDDRKTLDIPTELIEFLRDQKPWDAAATAKWLASQRKLLDEVRAIGLLPDASSNGIAIHRWFFIDASLLKSFADALLLEARLAAAEGRTASALESVRAARGLADHFINVERSTLLMATVQILVHLNVQAFALREIIPALPAGQLDPAAWERAVNPRFFTPASYAALLKGEYAAVCYYLLPALLIGDPHSPRDSGAFLDAFCRLLLQDVRNYEAATLADLPKLPSSPAPDHSHLSKGSRELLDILSVGLGAWRQGWVRAQSVLAMNQAAFAILKGDAIPMDPVCGKPYVWDPATRKLSVPAIPYLEGLKIPPVTVPKP